MAPNDPKQKEQKQGRGNKAEFEGTFKTEAKDWAGELISGQTTTGRILVSTRARGVQYIDEPLTVATARINCVCFSVL